MEHKTSASLFQMTRQTSEDAKESKELQQALFPRSSSCAFIFVQFPDVTDDEFISVIDSAKPGCVVELRGAPRFDIGRLNRKAAFDVFTRNQTTYLDFVAPGAMDLNYIKAKLEEFSACLTSHRPLMFLVNASQYSSAFAGEVLRILQLKWEDRDICEIPAPPTQKQAC